MVSVTITFEIFKLRYYVYCALFDFSCKLLLSIYLISAMCYTYYSTYYSSIFCLIYYRVVVKINLYQCQCQCLSMGVFLSSRYKLSGGIEITLIKENKVDK